MNKAEQDAQSLQHSDPLLNIDPDHALGRFVKDSDENRNHYDRTVNQARSFQDAVKEISSEVLKILGREAESAKRRSLFFNRLSLGLYTLGVIVTATGQLVKKDEDLSLLE